MTQSEVQLETTQKRSESEQRPTTKSCILHKETTYPHSRSHHFTRYGQPLRHSFRNNTEQDSQTFISSDILF